MATGLQSGVSELRLTFALVSALSTMVLFGGFDMVRGVAAPYMQRDWHLSYMQLGDAFMANSVGYLAGSFVSGFFVARMGTRKAILLGGGLLIVGTGIVVGYSSYASLAVGFALSGLATGCLELAVNQVVPETTSSGAEQARYFNALHGFYGVGSFAYPVIAAALIALTGNWRTGYLVLLVALVLLWIAVWWWPGRRRGSDRPGAGATAVTVSSSDVHPTSSEQDKPLPWIALSLLMVTLLAYTTAEVILSNWLPTYLVHVKGLTVLASSYALSGFYLIYTIGRLTGPFWVHRIGPYRTVWISALFALVLCVIALVSKTGVIWLFCLSGAGFAAIFPTITAVASAMDTRQSGRVLGILFTVAGFAGLVANGLVGAVSTAFGLAAGFSSIAVLLAIVLLGMVGVGTLELRTRYTGQREQA